MTPKVRSKIYRDTLSDSYVKTLLKREGYSELDIILYPNIIGLKRISLMMYRVKKAARNEFEKQRALRAFLDNSIN